jgi:hypothetical protein
MGFECEGGRVPFLPRSRGQPGGQLVRPVYNLLGDMSFGVERINGVRLALDARAAKSPANDPLAGRLRAASAQVDELRRKIVATKEGGAITGEERLRENLADLYGNVNGYEGRPAQTQLDRADAITPLAREGWEKTK